MKHILSTALLICAATGFSQDTINPALTQEVVTFGSRDLKLKDAFRIASYPTLYDTIMDKAEVKYNVLPSFVPTKYQVSAIPAARLKVSEPLNKLYHSYAKLGFGTYVTPMAELYFNGLRSRKGSFGFYGKHLSSNGGLNDYLSEGAFSDNQVGFWGKSLFNRMALSGAVNYNRLVNNFYGIPLDSLGFGPLDAPSPQEDTIQQKLNNITANIGLESLFGQSAGLNFSVNAGFRHTSNNYDTKETNILGDVLLRKQVNTEEFNFLVQADVNNYQQGLFPSDSMGVEQNNTILKFNPYVVSRGEKVNFKVGLNVSAQMQNGSRFYFFPDANISYDLIENILLPYAGIDGGIKRNSYFSTYSTNNWAAPYSTLTNTVNKFRLYGGLRGNFSKNSTFNLMFEHTKADSVQLFLNDEWNGVGNMFAAVYDNLSITTLTGEFGLFVNEKWKSQIKGEYFIYSVRGDNELYDSLGVERMAYNMPKARISWLLRYNLKDKIVLTSTSRFEAGRKTLEYMPSASLAAPGEISLDNYFDIDLGAEYRYTSRFSGFLKLNNLLSKSYQKWYNYPVQRIQVMAGVTYSF